MREECYDFIPRIAEYAKEGLPDDVADHVENCPTCGAALEVHARLTVNYLRALWRKKEPERTAQERFRNDCRAWHETWRGWVYSWFGGPFWSRRAKLLGIPQWENYKPKEQ